MSSHPSRHLDSRNWHIFRAKVAMLCLSIILLIVSAYLMLTSFGHLDHLRVYRAGKAKDRLFARFEWARFVTYAHALAIALAVITNCVGVLCSHLSLIAYGLAVHVLFVWMHVLDLAERNSTEPNSSATLLFIHVLLVILNGRVWQLLNRSNYLAMRRLAAEHRAHPMELHEKKLEEQYLKNELRNEINPEIQEEQLIEMQIQPNKCVRSKNTESMEEHSVQRNFEQRHLEHKNVPKPTLEQRYLEKTRQEDHLKKIERHMLEKKKLLNDKVYQNTEEEHKNITVPIIHKLEQSSDMKKDALMLNKPEMCFDPKFGEIRREVKMMFIEKEIWEQRAFAENN